MYVILKLIILLQAYICLHKCKAYVLQTAQQENNNNDLSGNNNKNPSMYIDDMIRPAEIKEPSSLQEIVNYVGADKLSNAAVMVQQDNDQQALTYTQLANLLSFWQWAKQQNFYEMQTDQPDINNNFVTVD